MTALMTLTVHVTRAFNIDVSSSRVVCVISMQGIQTGPFLSLSCNILATSGFVCITLHIKLLDFSGTKTLSWLLLQLSCYYFYGCCTQVFLLLLSFRHFELLNSERAKATFENTIVKSGSCLADEISSEQLYLRNVEEFKTV